MAAIRNACKAQGSFKLRDGDALYQRRTLPDVHGGGLLGRDQGDLLRLDQCGRAGIRRFRRQHDLCARSASRSANARSRRGRSCARRRWRCGRNTATRRTGCRTERPTAPAAACAPTSPMMPRRKASTQITKMAPWVTVTQSPNCARYVSIATTSTRRPPGRRSCPCRRAASSAPPRRTCDQCTSVSVAMPNTSAFVPPATPARNAGQHEGQQLVVVRRGSRARSRAARSRGSPSAPGRTASARCGGSAGSRSGRSPATSQYIAMSDCSEISPNRVPRGTCWMPSSPPVNGASRQKK